jgi:hypothetical protein
VIASLGSCILTVGGDWVTRRSILLEPKLVEWRFFKRTYEFSSGALDPRARIAFKARRRARSSVGRARDF